MHIIKIEGNTIFYKCTCGILGKCIVKPLLACDETLTIITCPGCHKSITTSLSDTSIKKDEDTLYSFAIVLNNEIIGEVDV